jgi:hypothetical protein
MKLEIDDEMVTKIILTELKKDYISQQEEIRRLKQCPGPLKQFEYEDMFNAFDLSEAIETVLKYYMYRPEAEEFIAQHSVRKRN